MTKFIIVRYCPDLIAREYINLGVFCFDPKYPNESFTGKFLEDLTLLELLIGRDRCIGIRQLIDVYEELTYSRFEALYLQSPNDLSCMTYIDGGVGTEEPKDAVHTYFEKVVKLCRLRSA